MEFRRWTDHDRVEVAINGAVNVERVAVRQGLWLVRFREKSPASIRRTGGATSSVPAPPATTSRLTRGCAVPAISAWAAELSDGAGRPGPSGREEMALTATAAP
jgi:hypothetical protein